MAEQSYMTLTEAAKFLGVSPFKLRQFIAEKLLNPVPDVFDKRVTLVPRREVEALAAMRKNPGTGSGDLGKIEVPAA